MMDDIKKNELNEQEMENVTGGWFHEPEFEESVMEGLGSAYDTVSDAAGTAWEVVKYTFEKNFLK